MKGDSNRIPPQPITRRLLPCEDEQQSQNQAETNDIFQDLEDIVDLETFLQGIPRPMPDDTQFWDDLDPIPTGTSLSMDLDLVNELNAVFD